MNAECVGSCHTLDLEVSFMQGKMIVVWVCVLGEQEENDIRIKRREGKPLAPIVFISWFG